jgi:hypothetical protein
MDNVILKRLERLEKLSGETERRLARLEQGTGANGEATPGVPEKLEGVILNLPEALVGGLRFNEQTVEGTFELHDDGWYHCSDVLFLSARNIESDNRRDVLMEYLNKEFVRSAFLEAVLDELDAGSEGMDISIISLPKENKGVKKYNGVVCSYWLKNIRSGVVNSFEYADCCGGIGVIDARSVCGCAPMFRLTRGE